MTPPLSEPGPAVAEPTAGAPVDGPVAAVLDALLGAVELARTAAIEDADSGTVGRHVEAYAEGQDAVTHLFEADYPGYRGWRWAVTVACAGVPDDDNPITISEVVLLPGPDALVAPEWVPWERRVRAGDLGVGDLLPTSPDDPRLEPAYLLPESEDEAEDAAITALAPELGLGRPRVMSREGRLDAAQRWHAGDFGPEAEQAASAQGKCGTCGFYLPLAGVLRSAFGACANEYSPADGHVVHVEYGCGAHSEVEVEPAPVVAVGELVYDDSRLDVEHVVVPAAAEPASVESGAADPVAGQPVEAATASG